MRICNLVLIISLSTLTYGNAHSTLVTKLEQKFMDNICAYYPGCLCSKVNNKIHEFQINCPKLSSTPVIKIQSSVDNWTTILSVICESSKIEIQLPRIIKTLNNYATGYLLDEIFEIQIKNCKLSNEIHDDGVEQKYHPDLLLENVSNINKNAFIDITFHTIEIINSDLNGKLEFLNKITTLESLFLDNNNITSLDGLTTRNLIELSSFRNKVESISRKTFENVKNLKFCRLEGTEIKIIDKDTFADLELLRLLIASDRIAIEQDTFDFENQIYNSIDMFNENKSMGEIPAGVFLNSNIHSLTLSCGLKKISNSAFGVMPKLLFLSLNDNFLTVLPSDFTFSFPELLFLNLSHNFLVDLPDNFLDTSNNFFSLDLSFNKFTKWRRLVADHKTLFSRFHMKLYFDF